MNDRYLPTARVLHWVTVAAMVAQFILGVWITTFLPAEESLKRVLFAIHENIGFSLLPLTLYRLRFRLAHPPAPLPDEMPIIMRLAAHANHWALYLALIAMPILGLLASTAWGFPFSWLGVIPIPLPFGKNEALAQFFSLLHFIGAWALGLAILAHVGGALYHGVIRRDGILQRML